MAIAESMFARSTVIDLTTESFLEYLIEKGGMRCSINTTLALVDCDIGAGVIELINEGLVTVSPMDGFEIWTCRLCDKNESQR